MLKVTYDGDLLSISGYSKAARSHAKALIQAGVDVLFEDRRHDMVQAPKDEWWAKEYPIRVSRNERTPIKIVHHTPDLCSPNPGQLTVSMVAWETSRIPDKDLANNPRYNWVKQLNKVDLVWTFCNKAKEAMQTCGVETQIDVIPHPIDNTIYHPIENKDKVELFDSHKQPIHDGLFKFLNIGQWLPRKDPKSMLLAYFSEFGPTDNVVFILKTYYMKGGDLDPIKKAVKALKQEYRLPYEHPRVLLVPGILSDAQIADLMRSCDCSVTTSKGEGFALNAAESMACGTPVIAPAGSSFLDYITEQNGYPVKVHEEPVYGVSNSPWYFSDQTWHRSDIKDLKRRMREAYENRDMLQQKGSKAAEDIKTQFSPYAIGQKMRDSLEGLMARSGRF